MPRPDDAEMDAARDEVLARMGTHRADLEELVRIPSVSATGFDPAQVRRAAEATLELLSARGLEHTRLLEIGGAHPAVYGDRLDAGPDAPTVLLYAHHDVQPPGDPDAWTSPAFEPTERDGRLYGRGTGDDKAGIMVHVAAIDAWLRTRGSLPCNVKVFIEGEEETGSEHLAAFLSEYGDMLQADVIVIADGMNWKVGVPSLTYLLRGLVDAEIEVAGLDHAVHSGMYGGPVPDPLTGLVKVLAAMTDESGEAAIPGFADDVRAPTPEERRRLEDLDFDEDTFRAEAGMLDGVELIGDSSAHPLERVWMRPNITIIGLDATPTAIASNSLPPSARAKVSVRLAPGQDPQRCLQLLCGWLHAAVPWGLHATVTPGAAAGSFVADPTGPAFQAAMDALRTAYGTEPVLAGLGGSIPFIEPFAQAFAGPDGHPVPALLTGVEDPDTRAHGIDESLHLEDFERACVAHALLLAELAGALGR